MTPQFEKELNQKLAAYNKWANENTFRKCRFVQFCGVDFIGAIDVERLFALFAFKSIKDLILQKEVNE